MDANGHRFWMLSQAGDFDLSDGSCQWSGDCLHLAGSMQLDLPDDARAEAVRTSNLPPVTVGHFGDWAWYDAEYAHEGHPGAIMAATEDGPLQPIYAIPEGADLRDMAVDEEGLVRVVGDISEEVKGLIIADLRRRWRDPVVIPVDADPDRVAEKWVLERRTGRLWREAGIGLADLAVRSYAEHIFRPDPEYTNPLRLKEMPPLELPGSYRIQDCAARADGLLAVLAISRAPAKTTEVVFVRPKGPRLRLKVPVDGFASSIGFVSDSRIALTYPGSKRAVVLDIGGQDPTALSIEPNRYPLAETFNMRLCRGTVQPVHAMHTRARRPAGPPRPLHPLSLPGYRAEGTAAADTVIHSGSAANVWHRLVVEADLPRGTGLLIELQAADREDALDAAPVHTHALGEVPAVAPGTPRLAWLGTPSELPLNAGLLGRTPVRDRTGCFSVLVQNTGAVSREVAGRYARLRLRLYGRGQATPSVAAVRLYGGRFSLVRNYLPAVLQPPVDPALRDTAGDAHPLDFYDRYVASFESVLTRLEDTVVAAPALTDPMAAPEDALDWLAGWIGLVMKSGLNTRQRRVMLANGMRLHRRRGTLAGLRLALDIASEGQVSAGGIVALEDFRLRRVFSTILGANLGSDFDPLLAGPVESANSFVGLTLHLGDADEIEDGEPKLSASQQAEISALYRAPTDTESLEDVRAFFARLAWHITVLVHHEIDETRMALLRDVAAQMTPGHVKLRVERATKPLIVGLYSLLGVDSYLKPRPGASPTILDQSRLGEKDQILSLPSLDPSADYGGKP